MVDEISDPRDRRIADLEATLSTVQTQLQLLTQAWLRDNTMLMQITKGQMVRHQAKPGHEKEIAYVPVPDDAPIIMLKPVPMKTSSILTAGGLPVNGNGRH